MDEGVWYHAPHNHQYVGLYEYLQHNIIWLNRDITKCKLKTWMNLLCCFNTDSHVDPLPDNGTPSWIDLLFIIWQKWQSRHIGPYTLQTHSIYNHITLGLNSQIWSWEIQRDSTPKISQVGAQNVAHQE